MDEHGGAGRRLAAHADWRGRLCAVALGHERRAAGGVPRLIRRSAAFRRRQNRVHRRHPAGVVRFENRVVCAGVRTDAGGGRDLRLEIELRRDRADVARRLHYPLGVFGENQGGVRPAARSAESALRPIFHGKRRRRASRVAQGGRRRAAERHSDSGVCLRALLLRRLSQRTPSGEPAASAARLFWGAYIRAR